MNIARLPWRAAFKESKSLVLCALLYAFVLASGVLLVLTVSTAIGYLPYSDRPGPGWFSPHLPTLRELSFFASWAFFFVGPFALLWGAILFVFIRFIAWLGAPKWLLRVLGGIFAGILGLLGTDAAGWYIAMSAVGVHAGALSGLAYGTLLLPRFAVVRSEARPRLWQWSGIIGATIILTTGIVFPLLPDRDAQSLEVQVVRLVPGSQEITVENTGLNASEVGVLRSLGLRGKLYGGIQSFSTGSNKQARALIVVCGPISKKVVLREPSATGVVYVQEGESWHIYPSNAPTLRKTITLTNSAGEYEGLSLAVEPTVGKAHSFTWYPPIKRIQSNR
jgi:hypothetical protein